MHQHQHHEHSTRDFLALSPAQAETLPLLRDQLAQAFVATTTKALALAGTSNFHLAGQPRIAIEAVRRSDNVQSGVPVTIVPIALTGVPGSPVFEFHITDEEVRTLMIALLRAQGR
jgi:hypothetical protein